MTSNEVENAKRRIQSVIHIALQIGIAMTFVCLLFADPIGKFFYNQNDLGPYIRFLGYLAPLFYLSSVSRGILNGLGKQNILLRNTIVFSIIEDVLVYILIAIPSINIYGLGIAMGITGLITISVNYYEIHKIIPFTPIRRKIKSTLCLNLINKV